MKKLIICVLAILCVVSCDYRDLPLSDRIIGNQGIIMHIITGRENKVYIEIMFKNSNKYINYIWVEGSDTCRIGQIVKLR